MEIHSAPVNIGEAQRFIFLAGFSPKVSNFPFSGVGGRAREGGTLLPLGTDACRRTRILGLRDKKAPHAKSKQAKGSLARYRGRENVCGCGPWAVFDLKRSRKGAKTVSGGGDRFWNVLMN